jgi:ATP diphosphatase
MKTINKLLEVMAALRDPDSGCPWDLKQDFSTIAPYTIEEAYEVADAIERADFVGLRDELGDLLLQVVFHARMAEEAGHFDFNDVAATITDKMLRRHPHVFGTEEERASGPTPGAWERIKAEERETRQDSSVMAGVAKALPALKRAQKLGERANSVGFDWPDRSGVRAKISEELDELSAAVGTRSADSIEEEFGDLLFAIVNLARHLEIDPEKALTRANYKFENRFREMEREITDRGKALTDFSLESLDQEWRAAKRRVG